MTMIAAGTFWFALTYWLNDGSSQTHIYGDMASLEVCEAVMRREIQAALYLMGPYRLRGLSTSPCAEEEERNA